MRAVTSPDSGSSSLEMKLYPVSRNRNKLDYILITLGIHATELVLIPQVIKII
jgi:hypothetical protein